MQRISTERQSCQRPQSGHSTELHTDANADWSPSSRICPAISKATFYFELLPPEPLELLEPDDVLVLDTFEPPLGAAGRGAEILTVG